VKQVKNFNPLRLAEFMNRLDFFRALRVEDKSVIIDKKLLTIRSYSEGEYVIRFGDSGSEFFMLMSGEAHVLTEAGNKVAEISPGKFFGEVAFALNEKRTASIVAGSDIIVMVLDNKTLQLMPVRVRELIKDKLIWGLVNRVSDLNRRIESLF
jgi:cAMP-dependent protein kinase regulator